MAKLRGLDSPLTDLNARFIDDGTAGWSGTYSWLWRNAEHIDLLILFHICTRSICQALIYKWRNPHGYLYLRADIASEQVGYAAFFQARNLLSGPKRWLLSKALMSKADLVSVECSRTYHKVRAIPRDKLIHIPNGFWCGLAEHYGVTQRPFSTKEKPLRNCWCCHPGRTVSLWCAARRCISGTRSS